MYKWLYRLGSEDGVQRRGVGRRGREDGDGDDGGEEERGGGTAVR